MAAVTTTIVVQFSASGGSSSGLSAEIDSRAAGLNLGKTQFLPGDTAYFLVFASGSAVIDSVLSSAGGVSAVGPGLFAVDEFITFNNERTANLSKPYASGGLYTWYGNNLGAVTFNPTSNQVQIAAAGVGVARVTYNASYQAYGMNSPATINNETTFQILAVVIGHDSNP